jgi:hypothetical protein
MVKSRLFAAMLPVFSPMLNVVLPPLFRRDLCTHGPFALINLYASDQRLGVEIRGCSVNLSESKTIAFEERVV